MYGNQALGGAQEGKDRGGVDSVWVLCRANGREHGKGKINMRRNKHTLGREGLSSHQYLKQNSVENIPHPPRLLINQFQNHTDH